jgi:GNAT superfamily N-acetyltransferase
VTAPVDFDSDDRPRFHEAGRSYISTALLTLLLAAGWVADLLLGGGLSHAPAWVAAIVIVVGADAWTVRTARRLRSVTLTTSELRVGEDAVPRASIVSVAREVQPGGRILGRKLGEGMPRGTRGVTFAMVDGGAVSVPVRDTEGLVVALGLSEEVPTIRRADASEYEHLIDVERRSDQLFALSGIGPLPEPGDAKALAAAAVVFAAGNPAVGFARVEIVDAHAHLEQVSVIPRAMRRGIGTALVQAVLRWATDEGYAEVTLITFADVAWNAPFYARLGFVPVEDLTPGLAELRDWERDLGLDSLGERVVMRRTLP